MAFSPTEAAFEGFRLTREQPRAVLWWIGLCLVVSVLSNLLGVAVVGADITRLGEAMADPAKHMDELTELGPQMALYYLAASPLLLGVSAVIGCAAYRAVLGGSDSRFGFLRLGPDEWRMFLLNLLLVLVFAGVVLAVAFAAAMLVSLGAGAGPVAGMIAGAAAFVAMGGGIAFVGVRLSLAGPMTFVERRIALGEAWRMTRGSFWPLFGAYLLAWTMAVVIEMLAKTIFISIGAAASGRMGTYMALLAGEPATYAEVFAPGRLLAVASMAVIAGLQFAIILGAPAIAYRELAGPRRQIVA